LATATYKQRYLLQQIITTNLIAVYNSKTGTFIYSTMFDALVENQALQGVDCASKHIVDELDVMVR